MSGTSGAHRRRRAGSAPSAGFLAFAGVVVVAGLVLAALLVGEPQFAVRVPGGDPAAGGPTAEGSAPSPAAPSSASPTPSPSPTVSPSPSENDEIVEAHILGLQQCRAAVVATQQTVSAGSSGVEHWRRHVESRTALLAGRMDRAEVAAIWKRTRQAGPGDVRRFDTAQRALAGHHGACAGLEPAPAGFRDATRSCLERYVAARAAVRATATAIGGWRHHLEDMARHAAGDLSDAEAQWHWVRSWKAAPPHLRAAAAAQDRLADAPACEVSRPS